MPKLHFPQLAFATHSCDLTEGRTTVGRSSRNYLVLNDPSESANHCELVVNANEGILRDHGSFNGTWVGGLESMASFQRITAISSGSAGLMPGWNWMDSGTMAPQRSLPTAPHHGPPGCKPIRRHSERSSGTVLPTRTPVTPRSQFPSPPNPHRQPRSQRRHPHSRIRRRPVALRDPGACRPRCCWLSFSPFSEFCE